MFRRFLRSSITPLLVALAFPLLVLSACSTAQEPTPESGESSSSNGASEIPVPSKNAPRSAAFAGIEEAGEVAAGWREDAGLYAIASIEPEVDDGGRSTGWLFTYVSESSESVASVAITDGKAKLAPELELPEDQIQDISQNVLPPPEELKDSSEAIEEAAKVREALKGGDDVRASAGLDSFSSEKPAWIFSTTQGDRRVEEKVPAAGS